METMQSSADRRFLMSVGPFTMAAGDSQEVVFGIFHAAGGDRLIFCSLSERS